MKRLQEDSDSSREDLIAAYHQKGITAAAFLAGARQALVSINLRFWLFLPPSLPLLARQSARPSLLKFCLGRVLERLYRGRQHSGQRCVSAKALS